jgi:putative hemolysin
MSMLWTGLAQFVLGRRFRYLMGAASINLADGGVQAAETYWHLTRTCLSPDTWRVFPYEPYIPKLTKFCGIVKLPPLIKGYVRLGAYMCGEPAWDRAFGTAHILMLLPIAPMDPRYARHYFGIAKLSGTEVA